MGSAQRSAGGPCAGPVLLEDLVGQSTARYFRPRTMPRSSSQPRYVRSSRWSTATSSPAAWSRGGPSLTAPPPSANLDLDVHAKGERRMAEMWTDSMTRRPAGPLRGSIEAYMGYQAIGFAPGLQRRVPSRHMTFVVSIGPPIDVRWETDPARRPERYRCVVGGLQTAAATIAHPGSQAGIAISLSPLGARAVFGVPAAELSDLSLEGADLLGRRGEELWEHLQHTSSWRERFDICDQVLRPQMGERRVSRELARCWQVTVASGGRVPVGRLAADTGYSRQHLTKLIRRSGASEP